MGRSHQALEKGSLAKCQNCGAVSKTHQACSACGFYGGRSVMKTRTDKKEAQRAKKDAKEKAKAKAKA